MSHDKEIAETFNNYFNNAVKSLNLHCDPEHSSCSESHCKFRDFTISDVSDENDPIEIAIRKFKNHPSIVYVNKNTQKNTTFSFDEIETDSLKKMIDNLDSRRSGTFGGIPANCLKGVSDI